MSAIIRVMSPQMKEFVMFEYGSAWSPPLQGTVFRQERAFQCVKKTEGKLILLPNAPITMLSSYCTDLKLRVMFCPHMAALGLWRSALAGWPELLNPEHHAHVISTRTTAETVNTATAWKQLAPSTRLLGRARFWNPSPAPNKGHDGRFSVGPSGKLGQGWVLLLLNTDRSCSCSSAHWHTRMRGQTAFGFPAKTRT